MSTLDENKKGRFQSYLTFYLNNELFAVNVSRVIEILELPKVTAVPKSKEYMLGVTNLRGNVLPVIDSRIKFGLPSAEPTVDTCIVVMTIEIEGDEMMLGALVDQVVEVIDLSDDEIKNSPSLSSQYNTEYLVGITKFKDDFVMVLDIENVFEPLETVNLKATTAP